MAGTSALAPLALSALQMGFSAQTQQREARQAEAARQSEARAQIEQIRQSQEIEERARRERLRRAVATQRARFGSQGTGSGGSATAVLSGLASEAERQDAEDQALTQTRIGRINDQLASSRRKNLLDASKSRNRMAFGFLQQGLRNIPLLDF